MITTILVPLDGSAFAETALPSARWIATRTGARIYLLRAHQPVPVLVGVAEASAFAPSPDLEATRREQQYLEETASRFGPVGGREVKTILVEGPAGDHVVEAAARIGADLIVMATHGRGALGRLWLGSVADHVVRHATIPVFLIRPNEAGIAESPAIRGILVPLDLSDTSEAILEPVIELASLSGASVTLLHVVQRYAIAFIPGAPYPIPEDPVFCGVQRAEAECRLEEVAGKLRLRGIPVSIRVVITTHPAFGVLEELAKPDHDIVALATHGAGGIRRLLLGSVADEVIRGAAKRILVTRPTEELH